MPKMKQLWAIESPQGILIRETARAFKYQAWGHVIAVFRAAGSREPWLWEVNPGRGAQRCGWKCVQVDVVKVQT